MRTAGSATAVPAAMLHAQLCASAGSAVVPPGGARSSTLTSGGPTIAATATREESDRTLRIASTNGVMPSMYGVSPFA